MLIENKEKRKLLSKWLIGIFAVCILIFLGVGHLNIIANAVTWLVDLTFPLLLGAGMALVFNVPMQPIEKVLFAKTTKPALHKLRRPLAILLSFVAVFGIFTGIAFLVIPELINACRVLMDTLATTVGDLAAFEQNIDYSSIPFGEELSKVNINWAELEAQLADFSASFSETAISTLASGIGSIASGFVDFFISLVFSIYLLANKEKLTRQILRLIRAWFPKRFGEVLLHITSVCGNTFQLFIAGQATEAIILGTLCTIGMFILRLPYAPMIGSLVGATALIPIVGAYVGAIVGVIMILTVNPFKALIFLIFIVVLQQVEGNLIYPKVVGSKINLPAMWVLAAITIGGNLAGPIGMLIGVPAFSSIYALVREATEKREQKKKEKAETESL